MLNLYLVLNALRCAVIYKDRKSVFDCKLRVKNKLQLIECLEYALLQSDKNIAKLNQTLNSDYASWLPKSDINLLREEINKEKSMKVKIKESLDLVRQFNIEDYEENHITTT